MGNSLRRRPIDQFKMICIHDPAFDLVPDSVVKAYVERRDFSIIADEIEKLDDKPAVFTCEPLRPAFDNVAVSPSVQDLKSIFAAHVKGIDNVPPELTPKFVRNGDKTYLETDYVDSLPLVFVVDVAGVIAKFGQGDTDPFSQPDGFWRRRAQREVRRHASALA